MRLWYLSHTRRPAKAHASLRICAVSPEPSLFAHMKYGRRRRVQPKNQTFSPIGWLRMCVWRMSLWRKKSAIISWWAGSNLICFPFRGSEVKHRSLLEEVKHSVNWDKRVSPTMNLRHGPVKAIPTAICFSLRNILDFTHSDIKELIEFKYRTKVRWRPAFSSTFRYPRSRRY